MSQQSPSTLFFQSLLPFIKPVFKIGDNLKFLQLQKAVGLYSQYTFIQDNLLDGDLDVYGAHEEGVNPLAVGSSSNARALVMLAQLFEPAHPFWTLFDSYMKEYYDTLLHEKHLARHKTVISQQVFEKNALGKHAPAFIPVEGMLYLFKCTASKEDLVKLLNHTFLAMQMLDDIEDFAEDLGSGHNTYVLSKTKDFIAQNALENPHELERFEERVFYMSDFGDAANEYAIEHFTRAREACTALGLDTYSQWVDAMLRILGHNKKVMASAKGA